jgi:hypothetical protein
LHRSPRLLVGSGALLIVIIGGVLALALTGGSGTPPPAPVAPLHSYAGPESIFNPDTALLTDPAQTLDQIKRLGAERVHIYLHWTDIAPNVSSTVRPSFNAADPAAYPPAGWAMFDTIIRDTKARGLGVDLALVAPPPRWASGKGAPHPSTQTEWRPSATEFGQFVTAVATRYSGHYIPPDATRPLPRVDFWSIWNEPDNGTQLAPQAVDHSQVEVSPTLYRKLLDAAWTALQATGHGHDTILIGEIAPAGSTTGVGPGNFNSMPPLRFLRALYCVDSSYRQLRGEAARLRGCPTTAAGSAEFAAQNPGLFDASGFSDHPYPQGLPPNTITPDEPDFAELAEIPRLERVLDALQRVYGSDTKFPIYSTEFGYQTTPPDTEAGTVSPQTAAAWLNWSEYLTWLDPRIRSYDQFLLTDPPRGNFASGLETAAGVPKPGFYAYRMPIYLPVTTTDRGHPLEVWGGVRPAYFARRDTHRPQRVKIQFRPTAGAHFETVATVTLTSLYGYFDVKLVLPATGTVRTAWTYPHGPQVFSRAVEVTLR